MRKWEKAPRRFGFVYFIRDDELDRIKIGFSCRHPEMRLEELCKETNRNLRIIGVKVGSIRSEKHLHAMFGHLLIGHEWFEAGEDLVAYIADIEYGEVFERNLEALKQIVRDGPTEELTAKFEPKPIQSSYVFDEATAAACAKYLRDEYGLLLSGYYDRYLPVCAEMEWEAMRETYNIARYGSLPKARKNWREKRGLSVRAKCPF